MAKISDIVPFIRGYAASLTETGGGGPGRLMIYAEH